MFLTKVKNNTAKILNQDTQCFVHLYTKPIRST